MADLGVGNSEVNAKNLLRIKADFKHLIKEQDLAKRIIDDTNSQIELEGPGISLEERLKCWIPAEHSIVLRKNIAVSVVGQCVEDLTEVSRDPPSVMAIKALLESIDNFTEETSLETLNATLVVIQDGDESMYIDVLEDLEKATESLSEKHILRTTEVLQATQLAVRDLAMDPSDRRLGRLLRPRAHHEEKHASASAGISPVTEILRGASQLEGSAHPKQSIQTPKDPAQILDTPSLHRYIDSVLPLVPFKRVVEAVQDLVKQYTPDHKSSNDHEPEESKEVTSKWKKDIEDRVKALEGPIRPRYEVWPDKNVKEEERSLSAEGSSDPPKRPSPGSEDKTDVKRSRF